MPVSRTPASARVWKRIDRSGGPDACWPFAGARNGAKPTGYGIVWEGGRHGHNLMAHRLVLEATLGRPIRPGFMALHRCDNPPCCNPAHLYEGTAQDNSDDAVIRRRTAFGIRRLDTSLRLVRAKHGEDATLDDPADWAYWSAMDVIDAAAAVARHVARVQSGAGVGTRQHWYGDPEMSFVPSDLVERDWPHASWGAA